MFKIPRLEEGLSTLALIFAMIIVAGMAIVEADLIAGLNVLPAIGSLGIVAGLALAKSRFQTKTAHLFSLAYGLFFLFLLLGPLSDAAIWRERIIDLVNRQFLWFQKAIDGGTSRDGLIFVIQTSAIFWVLGYSAAWYTFRRSLVWRAVLPTGMVLLSVVYYYVGEEPLLFYLAIYVILALIYVARTHLANEEKEWRARGVQYVRSIRFDFIRAGFLAAFLALALAWTIPTLSASAAVSDAVSGARGPWRRFQDNWTRLFSSLRAYGTGASDPYQDTLVLGGPRTVGSTPIMDIYVPERLPNVYWQAIAYDTYEDGRWDAATVTDTDLHFPDDGDLVTPKSLTRDEVKQTVINYLPNSSFLYAAPEVIGSNRQMFVEGSKLDDGTRLISSIRSRFVLRQGDRYQVASLISRADQESLRISSADYPDWIKDAYLQLPDSITAETVQLAERLVEGYNNPFDKAIAVRDFLREHIEYNDQIPAPPQGEDPVHHTLFVSREGYCNYYASSMAVMLRSQGIPARIVSGYAQGEWDGETSSYRVRASNAHTWVEVFFPQFGWIQFEPTATIPLVVRPETAGSSSFVPQPAFDLGNDEDTLFEELNALDRELGLGNGDLAGQDRGLIFTDFPVWQGIAALIVVVIAGSIMLVTSRYNRQVEADVERSYSRLGGWARWFDVLFRPTHTPYERADMLVTAVPEGSRAIRSLTQQFVLKRFSRRRATEDAFDPHDEWRVLRPLLIRRGIAYRIRRWQTRKERQRKPWIN